MKRGYSVANYQGRTYTTKRPRTNRQRILATAPPRPLPASSATRPEQKNWDCFITDSLSGLTAQYYYISNVQQGYGDESRIGRSVNLKSLFMKINLDFAEKSVDGQNRPQKVRIIAVQAVARNPTAIADVLETDAHTPGSSEPTPSTPAVITVSPVVNRFRQLDSSLEYRTLYDKVITSRYPNTQVDNSNTLVNVRSDVFLKKYIKLNDTEARFIDDIGGVTGVAGGITLILEQEYAFSDSPSTRYSISTRIRYTDK